VLGKNLSFHSRKWK